jgi:hypothetical protein
VAETINRLYEAGVIRRRGPWRSSEVVEFATLNGSTGSAIGASSSLLDNIPPAKRNNHTTHVPIYIAVDTAGL